MYFVEHITSLDFDMKTNFFFEGFNK